MQKELLKIKAIPGSSKNEIMRVENNELIIKIKAQAEKGKANKELIKFLSKKFSCSKTNIEFKSGENSRHKTLMVPQELISTLEEIGFKVDKNKKSC